MFSICRNINNLTLKEVLAVKLLLMKSWKNWEKFCISHYYKYEEIGAPKSYDPLDLHHIIPFADKFNQDPKLSLLLEETLVFLSTTNCTDEFEVTMDFIKTLLIVCQISMVVYMKIC